ncbi:hypothetical protein KQI84_08410 [bacterium]|nr:hypothetical protein [bacterium]
MTKKQKPIAHPHVPPPSSWPPGSEISENDLLHLLRAWESGPIPTEDVSLTLPEDEVIEATTLAEVALILADHIRNDKAEMDEYIQEHPQLSYYHSVCILSTENESRFHIRTTIYCPSEGGSIGYHSTVRKTEQSTYMVHLTS